MDALCRQVAYMEKQDKKLDARVRTWVIREVCLLPSPPFPQRADSFLLHNKEPWKGMLTNPQFFSVQPLHR